MKLHDDLGGVIGVLLLAAAITAIAFIGTTVYWHVHECKSMHERCGIFPIQLK